jgi:polar amino acid transport system substrate-binding protein
MTKKPSSILLTVLTAAITSLVVYIALPATPGPDHTAVARTETTFDRVMRTRTIRCGYYVFPPVTYRDPNTRELSGFTVDMMNEIGRRAGLKIEWAEETNFVTWTESLKAGRFDVACTPTWPGLSLALAVSLTRPMFYAGIYPLVRADDARFKSDLNVMERLNQPDVKFTTLEGDAIDRIVQDAFPKATVATLPTSAGDTTFVMDLLAGKTDVIVVDKNGAFEFNRANPGKLRHLDTIPPLKTMWLALAVDRNEMILKDFLDVAIDDLRYDGTLDNLMKKWEPEPGKTFLRAQVPVKE